MSIFSFGELQFPSWWDIHTHKANHTCTFPVYRSTYSFGRAAVGDWGRIGACQVLTDDSCVSVHEQISCNLVNKIHFSGSPIPVLPPNYHLPCKNFDSEIKDEISVATAVRENVFKHLIDDPLFSKQASAAFCCTRIFSVTRQNMPRQLREKSREFHSQRATYEHTRNFLHLVNRCSDEVLEAGCSKKAISNALDQITEFHKLTEEKLEKVDKPVPNVKTRKRKKSPVKIRHNPPLQPKLAAIFKIPLDSAECDQMKRQLTCNTAEHCPNLSASTKKNSTANRQPLHRLAAAIDPFLITLAGRRINPAFLGNGCLQVTQAPYTFQTKSPIVIWAPPHSQKDVKHLIPCIYAAPVSFLSYKQFPMSYGDFTKIELPEDSIGSTICELDTLQISDASVYVVARTTSGRVYTMSVTFCTDLDSDEMPQWSVTSALCVLSPELDFKPASIAVANWRPTFESSSLKSTDWVVAGRQCSPSQAHHEAVVQLYDAKTNETMWSGNIPLDQQGESITSEAIAAAAASSIEYTDGRKVNKELKAYENTAVYKDLLSYCGQVRQNSASPRLTPEQILRQAELKFELSHSSTWLRAGFADCPGLLTLVTPKRLLRLDTRVPSKDTVVQELFNLGNTMPSLGNGRIFNPSEHIFNAPPRFFKGTYALIGTDYNGLLLDKRMPGHPVLHWTHGLRGPLTYMDWCMTNSDCCPAQAMLITASQLPVDISVTGINFNTSSVKTRPLAPQVVGPSLSGGDLGSILKPSPGSLPSGLLSSNFFEERICVGLVGTAALPLISSDATTTVGVQGLSLTSAGDIFSHEWYFDKSNASQRSLEGLGSIQEWCNSFVSRGSNRVPLVNVSDNSKELFSQLEEVYTDASKDEKHDPSKELPMDVTETTIPTLADNYPNVLNSIGDMTYAKELCSDMEQLWEDDTFIPNILSDDRKVEEKSRQNFFDNIVAKVSR